MITEAQLISLSERIVGASFKVSNTLGTGFLETPVDYLRSSAFICGSNFP
jgi:hypothetical protein